MRRLSLHHMTALDLTVDALVEVAAAAGCAHVCLFTQQPADGIAMPAVLAADLPRVRRRMADAGVSALGITSFPLLPDTRPECYRGAIERGAALGARVANARIGDPHADRLTANWLAFAEICAGCGIAACVEFTGFANHGALAQARRMIDRAGAGAVTLDPLHIARTGTPWALIEALPAGEIGYVQLCDGPLAATGEDYAREQGFARLPPGDGQFPLARLLALLPRDMPLSIEVPCAALRAQGLDSRASAAEVVRRTRAHLATIGFG